MNKAIEEKWHARNSPACTDDIYKDTEPRGYIFIGNHRPDDPMSEDRAILAAHAPEMARMLLSMEWSGSYQVGLGDGTESCCPLCAQPAEYKVHSDSCAWLALMKRIGAR